MTLGRWIVISGQGSEAGVWALDVARELAQRNAVVFWDTTGEAVAAGKSLEQIVPYIHVFSDDLLQNFLRGNDDPLAIIRGASPLDLSLSGNLVRTLKNSFAFTLVLAPSRWDPAYLAYLDPADLLLTHTSINLSEQREQLVRHKFPKGLLLEARDTARATAQLLETDPAIYPPQATMESSSDVKTRVHQRLLQSHPEEGQTQAVLENLIAEETTLSPSRHVREQVLKDLLQDVLGLGPLEPLVKDPEVSEILVNGPDVIYVEKRGQLYPAEVRFESEAQLRTVIDRIVAPIGRRVDESSPLCDARLADGSRVNIVLPPLALDGPTLSIRKFMNQRLSLEDLIRFGALNKEMADFLAQAVKLRRNMVISGGTGSGKTTLLNILSNFISERERIVTIEDAAELKLQQPHVVRLESRPPNAEGQGAIPIRRLVINALRMRPDRIVVGECRGGEALDMLQAMNTGHEGSLTTLHANTPRDALGRLETLVLMSGVELPVRVVREQIRSAVHLIVQIARLSDGSRKITSITELTGMEGEVLSTAELFRYRDGVFESTGLVSSCRPR